VRYGGGFDGTRRGRRDGAALFAQRLDVAHHRREQLDIADRFT
jgi:hypothetical protein